jgi:hypothetical protein
MACHRPFKLVVERPPMFAISGATCARLSTAAMSMATAIVRHLSGLAIEGTYSYSLSLEASVQNQRVLSRAQHSLLGVVTNAQKLNLPPN